MSSKPQNNWSAVVVGRWNRAILSPNWIGRTLFGLAPGDDSMEVHVPMDTVGPWKAVHGGLTVTVDDNRLSVESSETTFTGLRRACDLIVKALEDLPKTPLLAAGFNVFMEIDPTDGERVLHGPMDDKLLAAGYETKSKLSERVLVWGVGTITFRVLKNEIGFTSHINFERRSREVVDLVQWMRFRQEDVQRATEQLEHAIRE